MSRFTAIAAGLVLAAAPLHAQYTPFGPQQNVGLSTILGGGWTQCFVSPMSTFIGFHAEQVLNACSGKSIMMAGRQTGSSTMLLLAAANVSDATFNTGTGNRLLTHQANGSEWYFAPDWSWGFAGAGSAVNKHQCDDRNGADRMCLHTTDFSGGYRIGDTKSLNRSNDYEKIFFVSDHDFAPQPVPEPSGAVLLATGLLGLVAMRRVRGRQSR